MSNYWLAIAPFDVCEVARRESFCQFGRGHMSPALLMRKDDGVVLMGRSRGSTATPETLYGIGVVDEGDAYAVPEQGREIWRRDVLWWPSEPAQLNLAGGRFGRQQTSFATVRGSARLTPAEFVQLADVLSVDWNAPFLERARALAAALPVVPERTRPPANRRRVIR